MNNSKLVLIGTGYMGLEYAKVLKAQGIDFTAVGRGQRSAQAFQQQIGITPSTGGADQFLSISKDSFSKAIVAVSGDQLGKVVLALIKKGVKSILVEKPGGLDQKEIRQILIAAHKHSLKVFIAYNRRFYSSVIEAQKIIAKDSGALSFHFEFNEPGYKIPQLEDSKKIQQNWLLHNSTHVIDLAFFLCGSPKTLSTHTSGFLSCCRSSAIFTGFGVSTNEAPFTYHANWLAPGRWGLEIMTKNHRLIFRPMEKLKAQKHGSFEIIDINIDDKLDTEFKPGIYREVQSFLEDEHSLCEIEKQVENLKWYDRILKG